MYLCPLKRKQIVMKSLYVVGLLLIFNACSGQKQKESAGKEAITRTFEMVSVPSMITEPEKRAEYLAQHYWDKFDFADTAYVHLPEVTEQAMSDYINVLQYASLEVVSNSLQQMMKRAEADSTVYAYFMGLYEKYLYDPNSPMRNEEFYIPVLQSVIASPLVDEVHKIRPAHLLELALKNRVGNPATDFTYTMANGQKGSLYQVKSDYLLLFFYNPDCHACKEITDQLSASPLVREWLKENKLKVLAMYPDEDLAAWEKHIPDMPAGWINSNDKSLSLKNDELYDLKAIPTLYLLDKEKKVILKDVTFQQFESYLSQIQTK